MRGRPPYFLIIFSPYISQNNWRWELALICVIWYEFTKMHTFDKNGSFYNLHYVNHLMSYICLFYISNSSQTDQVWCNFVSRTGEMRIIRFLKWISANNVSQMNSKLSTKCNSPCNWINQHLSLQRTLKKTNNTTNYNAITQLTFILNTNKNVFAP